MAGVAEPITFHYEPDGRVLDAFMRSDSFVRGIRGPWGSGKSAACCVEIFRRALGQAPDRHGVRRTRWAVIRNTGPQLKMTTIKTWLQWFPEHVFGKFTQSPPFRHSMRLGPLPDGTVMEAEVYFIAMDDPSDVDTLYSLELTGAWINEARFVPKEAIDAVTGRVNRYPSMKDGGASWAGVIMDTNAPAADHWWAIMSGEKPAPEWMSEADKLTMVKPANWQFYTQPPAMLETFSEKGELTGYEVNRGQRAGIFPAENLKNLAPTYYQDTIQGKTRSWIEVNILNRYGSTFDGKAVQMSFRAEIHVAKEVLKPIPGLDVWVGLDFGRTPAALFGQRQSLRWFIPYELVTRDMATSQFAPVLKAFCASRFPPGTKFHFYGDPSGGYPGQTDDATPFDILRAHGIHVYPTHTNDFQIRVEAVESVLTRMEDGKPCCVVSPICSTVIAGWEGGYHFRRLQISGTQELYAQEPVKNRYSHVCEAGQYMLLGAGEGRDLVSHRRDFKPVVAPRGGSIWQRHGLRRRG
jgi:hypothetical protein